ncbi:glucan endo-1,3-beta-glucosidase 6-like [Phoenix dactylifera]|uniref:glucan endo-1,3-beta-D-glucosidase n=1 Tax=Phoenix dactylifera TaxID=42345 RepID=A0A8B7BMQ1_PHODC|nr:glucan endo-1,3-beta-glucosidase 6-like [Phoenix dactylifera]
MMGRWSSGLLKVVSWLCLVGFVSGIGANWGTQASHPLPPNTVVQMLRDNGFQKVKLFDPEDSAMSALSKSQIQVMVGIPNEMLAGLASSMKVAENWVSKNISSYIKDGVDIRYVAVGNEPFLETYNGSFLQTTFPALQNIQSALIKAGVSSQVKVTVPLNADVYESSSGKPSDGDFRANIHDLMVAIVKFLSDNGAPFTVNIYPFISLYNDPNFPVDYAFLYGPTASPVGDGSITYTNVFDANHDTLVWALQKSGFGNLSIIVGEIGWPTDGDMSANIQYAQRFNQGFMQRVSSGQGTPLRPGAIDAYLFSLIDEDQKSIQPGNFERHWGVFYYDGQPKYQLNISTSKTGTLVGAKNVKYLDKKWCVFTPSVSLDDSRVASAASYACAKADCTSLGYKTSCSDLDARGNISYAFNSYYQINDQDGRACDFQGTATTTDRDPSTSTCRFEIMIEAGSATSWRLAAVGGQGVGLVFYAFLPLLLTLL